MDGQVIFVIVVLSTVAAGALLLALRQSLRYRSIRDRYKDVIDIDARFDKVKNEVSELRNKYGTMKSVYDKLSAEVSLLEENLDDISYGLYKPHYDFDTSEKYKEKLGFIRSQQKAAIKAKSAATCAEEWKVGNSRAEGKKMVDKTIKLMLRAFNGECDSAVSKVRWNNVQQMLMRVEKSADAVNKLGESMKIVLSPGYVALKLEEIRLAHEYEQKRQEEKEEQRRIKEEMREEKKAQQELESARQKAEKEERQYEKALARARKELESTLGEESEKLRSEIAELEKRLELAHDLKARAISQAQMTRSGHVYVISNVGSFGDTVFKIGMTRRLDPFERVNELGDASVPFRFDVHAIIYSEDAPKLENELHKHFEARRVNLVNRRREFFRARIQEIEQVVHALGADIEFTKIAEAREYRESLAIRKASKESIQDESAKAVREESFPAVL